MHQGLAAADLVITSAGAITLAKYAVGCPHCLFKSYVAGSHQEYNARALEKRACGGADRELDGAALYNIVSNSLAAGSACGQ